MYRKKSAMTRCKMYVHVHVHVRTHKCTNLTLGSDESRPPNKTRETAISKADTIPTTCVAENMKAQIGPTSTKSIIFW